VKPGEFLALELSERARISRLRLRRNAKHLRGGEQGSASSGDLVQKLAAGHRREAHIPIETISFHQMPFKGKA
jgi:hypothetical protein